MHAIVKLNAVRRRVSFKGCHGWFHKEDVYDSEGTARVWSYKRTWNIWRIVRILRRRIMWSNSHSVKYSLSQLHSPTTTYECHIKLKLKV